MGVRGWRTLILLCLLAACLPMFAVMAFAGGAARPAAAFALVAVLIAMTVLIGLVLHTGNLGTWPYTLAVLAAEIAVAVVLTHRLWRSLRASD